MEGYYEHLKYQVGDSFPLGTTVKNNGVNFCIFSESCFSVQLLLFDTPQDSFPKKIINLDPTLNKTFYYWHIFVEDIGHGQLYGYRLKGIKDHKRGYFFHKNKVLLDPYAKAAVNTEYNRRKACESGDNCAQAYKSVVVDTSLYDWEGDLKPKIKYEKTLIYEVHVKGFTKHKSSGVTKNLRGTYAGLIEKIPYLKEMGFTAVELMPVFLFDHQDTVKPGVNYWGYSPINFFAIHPYYSTEPNDPLIAINEFRDMVKALHSAGIEVILDVVYNHTAESGETGPVLCFRGFENNVYYITDEKDKSKFLDFTGCGNTVNGNNSIVRRMILDSLKYWVSEMHVDGFRFDLASVLSRGKRGELLSDPPVLWEIESEPTLSSSKIIAEAWDAVGLYQVGSFVGDRWAEWNGEFRDDVRAFVKGENGYVRLFASRIVGSPDIFLDPNFLPNRSIHFITCHDGFTLYDLVTYNAKRNQENGEFNRDGLNQNFSWNCGKEGVTSNECINRLRIKQMKNFVVLVFFSQGTPMWLMGDEMGRTQKGNNNAYCQDNDTSWMDWGLIEKNRELLEFTRNVISFSKNLELNSLGYWMVSNRRDPYHPYIVWHGVKLNQPDWNLNSHTIAFDLHHPHENERLYIIVNCYWKPLEFEVPTDLEEGNFWHIRIDTFKEKGADFFEAENAPSLGETVITVNPRSTVVLMSLPISDLSSTDKIHF